MNNVICLYTHPLARAKATAEAVVHEARRHGLPEGQVRQLAAEARRRVIHGKTGGSVLADMYRTLMAISTGSLGEYNA